MRPAHALGARPCTQPQHGDVRPLPRGADRAAARGYRRDPALYGARTPDSFQSQGRGLGWSTSIDVTLAQARSGKATVGDVSLPTIGASEYFTVVAPNTPGATLQITAAAYNVSLLSPKLSVYDNSGNLLRDGVECLGLEQQRHGEYRPDRARPAVLHRGDRARPTIAWRSVAINFKSYSTGARRRTTRPPPSNPWTPPSGSITPPSPTVGPDRLESNNTFALATNLGVVAGTATVGNLTLNTSDVDNFVFRNGKAGIYRVTAGGTAIRVYDGFGNQLASGSGELLIRIFKPRTSLYVQISSPTGAENENYLVDRCRPEGERGGGGSGSEAGPGSSTGRAWCGAAAALGPLKLSASVW